MSVVKSIAETSECVPVNFDINVDWKCRQYPALHIKRFPKVVTYLSDGWEANESNRGYPGSRNIEAHTGTAAAAA